MRILTLDCETTDPNLRTYGAGWCFKYHYPEVVFEVLGVGTIDYAGAGKYFNLNNSGDNVATLLDLINSHDALLCHNSMYDIGCLRYLYKDKGASLFDNHTVIDTMILAQQANQQLLSYSLDSLLSSYGCEAKKESDILRDYAWLSGLYQEDYKNCKKRNCNSRPTDTVLEKWCKTNMKVFPDSLVEKYCLKDCEGTLELYKKISEASESSPARAQTNSDIIKVCIEAKLNGFRIDLNYAEELGRKWEEVAKEEEHSIREYLEAPDTFNVNSGKQLAAFLDNKGHIVPVLASGNRSITASWLSEQDSSIFYHIRRYRKARKAKKDYIQKLIKYQEVIPHKYREKGIGRFYPTLKPYSAVATGRFTSGGGTGSLELNVLAVSGHDEEFGLPIRKLFLPHKGEKLVVGDFSNQEPRLQVHYACMLGCKGAKDIQKSWIDNPTMKYHQKVADMTGFPYSTAKTITLGLAYDMRARGLSSLLKIEYGSAQELIDKYYELLPFMKSLQRLTAKNLLKLGYIRTIGGRKLYIDPPCVFGGKVKTQERKAMSKLIQGSGADQTIKALIEAHKKRRKILLCVHDEIILSSSQPEVDRQELKSIMETCMDLCVPVVAEVKIGNNWAEGK